MPTAHISARCEIAGLKFDGKLSRTADGSRSHEIALPAGHAGTLDTRTDDDTGICALAAGHGLDTCESDLVEDGYFALGYLSGWTDASSGDGSASVVSGKCRLQTGASGTGQINQAIGGLVDGQTYTLKFTVSGTHNVSLMVNADTMVVMPTEFSAGTQSVEFVMDGTDISQLTFANAGSSSETTEVDGISLRRKPPVDVYWSGGMRYGMTGTLSGDNITIDGGSGDVLPSTTTAVVVTPQVIIRGGFDGDDLQLIAADCAERAHIDFQDSGNASLASVELLAGEQWAWVADQGIANPLTGGAVAFACASNGSMTASTLKLGILLDTTP